jgi:hypothetical protein
MILRLADVPRQSNFDRPVPEFAQVRRPNRLDLSAY